MSEPPRSILITGAGAGIGRGLSVELAARGHRILASDLDLDAARETVAMLPRGAEAEAAKIDVTRAEDVDRFQADRAAAPIDVLINNAGFQHVAPLESFDQGRWDDLLAVCLRGACLMTRAVLPRMRKAGFGRIVNIGSIHSIVASPYKSAYVAAKHGLAGFAKSVALETTDTDITINTICPAYVRTALVDAQIADQAAAHGITEQEVIDRIMLEPMPKGTFITFEEIAETTGFLISRAARNITGQMIVIDGGWTIR